MNFFPCKHESDSAGDPPTAMPARSAGMVAAGSGFSKIHISPQRSVGTVELFAGAGFMRVCLEASDLLTPKPKPPERGEINHFSDASRRRMIDLLAKVD